MGDNKVIDVLKSLADPTRLAIVRSLATCESGQKSCSDISAKIKLSQPAMSHHFGKLVDSGVVIEAKDGTKKIYRLNTALLATVGINAAKL